MRSWQCKCGKLRGFGSDGPSRCAYCDDCGTTVETSPEMHETTRRPHEYYQMQVETDEGMKTLSRCRYCHETKAKLEKIIL